MHLCLNIGTPATQRDQKTASKEIVQRLIPETTLYGVARTARTLHLPLAADLFAAAKGRSVAALARRKGPGYEGRLGVLVDDALPPPSTYSAWPVMYAAASEARNKVA